MCSPTCAGCGYVLTDHVPGTTTCVACEAEREPTCVGCHKPASEIKECQGEATVEGLTPAEWVRECEGTYNPQTNHFACTACYIRMGMPTAADRGWKAP